MPDRSEESAKALADFKEQQRKRSLEESGLLQKEPRQFSRGARDALKEFKASQISKRQPVRAPLSREQEGAAATSAMRTAVDVIAPMVAGPLGAGLVGGAARGVGLAGRALKGVRGAGRVAGAAASTGGVAKSFGDTDEDAALAAGLSGGAEAVSPVAGFLLKKSGVPQALAKGLKAVTKRAPVARPVGGGVLQGSLRPGAREAIEQLGDRAVVTPGIASTNRVVRTLENVADASILGGNKVSAARENATRVAAGDLTSYIDNLGNALGPEDLGKAVKLSIDGELKHFRAIARAKYARIDEMARPVISERTVSRTAPSAAGLVDASGRPVAVVAKEKIEEITAGAVDLSTAKKVAAQKLRDFKVSPVKSKSQSILENIVDGPSSVTFEDAQIIRSDLLAVSRDITDVIAGRGQSVSKALTPHIDRAMDNTAREIGGELHAAFREASKFWKDGADVLNSDIVKQIANSDPELMLGIALRNPRNTSAIRRVRESINDPKVWKNVQQEWIAEVMTLNQAPGELVDGKKVRGAIKRFEDTGALDELIPSKVQQRALKQFSDTLALTQGGSGDKTGAIAIQLLQAGALINFSGDVGASAAILLGPLALAEALTNPSIANFLTVGMREAPGSKTAGRALSQAIASLARQGFGDEIKVVVDDLGIDLGIDLQLSPGASQVRNSRERN